MTDAIKVQAYQDAYELLNQKKEISKLYYPEEKKHYDIYFNVSDVECFYSLNSNVDMLRIEAVKKYESKTDVELSQISEEVLKDTTDIRSTFYDNKIKFLSNTVFTGTEDSAAKSMIDNAVANFVAFLISNFYVEPEVTEEIIPEDEEIEDEVAEEIKVEQVVYSTKEFENVEKITDFRDDSLPERQSKGLHDIKFPTIDDIKLEEIEEKTNEDTVDLFKDFVIPEINVQPEFSFSTPNEAIPPAPYPGTPSQNPDLEARERALYYKAQQLEKKEQELNIKNDEIMRLYKSIEPQKQELNARFAQLQKDANALSKAKEDLEARAKQLLQSPTANSDSKRQLLQYQEYIKELKSEYSKLEKDLESNDAAYKQLQNAYEVLKVDSNNKIETLNNRVIELQNDNLENVNKGNTENERLTEIITEKNQEIDNIQSEKEALIAQLKEKEEEIEGNIREVEKLQKELSEIPRVMPIQKVKECLLEEGIELDVVAGEGGDILVCENYNNCKIVVNCDLTIFYIKKDIKKAIRYTGQVNTYNEEDIRYTYVIGNENISCKGIYRDAAAEIKACLEKFDAFKQQ